MCDQPPPTPLRRAAPWFILLGLTAYAGFSRFFMLSQPTLWGDEIATYYRVAGDFDHLMNRLRNDGFVPLHYLAYWWLDHHVTLTPFWMRFVPALCGALTVPAVFLLARQLFSQKTALVAAALAASSAWLMTYARDAKMYADTWLFVTLGLGLLLWWLRQTGWRSLATWPFWVVCAAASVWLHATAILIVLAYPIALLLRLPEHRWYQKDLLILGMLVALAGPWWYYTQYNRFVERTGIFVIDEEEESLDGSTGTEAGSRGSSSTTKAKRRGS